MYAGDHHSETSPLLHQHDSDDEGDSRTTPNPDSKHIHWTRALVGGSLLLLFAVALVLILCFEQSLPDSVRPWLGLLPKDPMTAALAILKVAPVIVSIFSIQLVRIPC